MRHAVLLATALSLSALLAGGCVDDGLEAAELAVAGTPDELAVLRFLNDDSTTFAVLDTQVKLDRRAAQNLVAHRDGGDPFDSIDEVDAIAYVGPTPLQKLVDFARAGDWVRDDELFGTFDGVDFTMAEARAAIALVNTASAATLKDGVRLDARAVRSILDARPVLTMTELAGLYYVGTAMMTRLRAHVATPTSCDDAALVAGLHAVADGLWLTSESDYPLEVVAWPGQAAAGASAASMLRLLGLPSTTPVRVGSFDRMMTRLGYSNDEVAVAALRAFLTGNLTELRVYEVGLIQVHDYVVGTSRCGGLVGIAAISIET